MRELLEAALYALSRGNVDEATEHVTQALAQLPEAAPAVDPTPAEGEASGVSDT